MSERKQTAPEAAAEWWREMNFDDGWRRAGGAKRAALARLRRAAGPIEALSVPQAVDLYRTLHALDRRIDPDRVAAVAVALANLRPEKDNLSPGSRVPQVFGRVSIDDEKGSNRAGRRPLAEARFRRLLQAEGPELMEAFRRLVRFLDGRAEPGSLAEAILYWGDPVRRRWIFGYYGVAFAGRDDGHGAATPPSG